MLACDARNSGKTRLQRRIAAGELACGDARPRQSAIEGIRCGHRQKNTWKRQRQVKGGRFARIAAHLRDAVAQHTGQDGRLPCAQEKQNFYHRRGIGCPGVKAIRGHGKIQRNRSARLCIQFKGDFPGGQGLARGNGLGAKGIDTRIIGLHIQRKTHVLARRIRGDAHAAQPGVRRGVKHHAAGDARGPHGLKAQAQRAALSQAQRIGHIQGQ